MQALKIKLKTLGFNNFCGSDKEEYFFYDGRTDISGQNGAGKSRINNAFNYLLYDKNADDRKDFNIKNTVDLSKNRQEHEVWGIINVNDSDIALRKVFKEEWTKRQGSQKVEFTGNKTEYYFNDVPCSQKEYKAKIDALIQEDLFKILTKVDHFTKLNWKVQRDFIFKLVPEVTDAEVAAGNKDLQELLADLKNGKTMVEYKREISSKKTKVREDLKGIPERIDEVSKGKPEVEDYPALKLEISALNKKIEGVEAIITAQLTGVNAEALEQQTQQNKVNELKSELQALEFKIRQDNSAASNELTAKKQECRNKIDNLERQIQNSQANISRLQGLVTTTEESLTKLRIEFDEVNASKFELNEESTTCPQCYQKLPDAEDKVETLKAAFAKTKQEKLAKLNEVGPALANSKGTYTNDIASSIEALAEMNEELKKAKEEFLTLNATVLPNIDELISKNEGVVKLKTNISVEEHKLVKPEPIDQSELKSEIEGYRYDITQLNFRLNKEQLIKDADVRIQELAAKESKLSQDLADLEKIEFTINKFDKTRVDKVEGQVNAKFKLVKFRLFDKLVNGDEVADCTPTINGVPFNDTNTANRTIAGLDIINTFSQHYNVFAPVFIDNAESIENKNIPEISSQLITLSVSGDKKITVS